MKKSKEPGPKGTKGPMIVVKPGRRGLGFEKLRTKVVPGIKKVGETVSENENWESPD